MSGTWGADFARAGVIVIAAAALGLTVNAFKARPLTILDANGPGAIPTEPRIAPAQLADLLNTQKSVLLLDVRNDDTYLMGHAPQALHVPEPQFDAYYREQNLAAMLRASDDVVVLCDSSECPSADRIAKTLRELGHANVRVLRDGWRGYLQTGMPVEPPGQTAATPGPGS